MEAGAGGGYVIAEGSIPQIIANKNSMIAPFLAKTKDLRIRQPIAPEELFALENCIFPPTASIR